MGVGSDRTMLQRVTTLRSLSAEQDICNIAMPIADMVLDMINGADEV